MQTHQFKLEFIFGKGIPSFPPGTVPIEADLVRRWVFEYDRMRGDRIRPGEAFQHEVISSVVGFITSTTANGYSTLFCNINNQSEIQCVVHMRESMPTIHDCEIKYGSDQFDFCGALHDLHHHCSQMLPRQ